MEAQYAGCIAFLRSEFQPWQPARCVIGDEIDELLADAWPDAEPDTLGLLRGPLQTAAVVARYQHSPTVSANNSGIHPSTHPPSSIS